MKYSRIAAAVLGLTVFASPAISQTYLPPPVRVADLSGPRIGLTVLDPGVVNELHDKAIPVRPLITQFGWQFERQFFAKGSGLAAVTEWVFLLGGLEQSLALPSATWMVGIRTGTGTEFGIGPNVTPAGVGLALAAGLTVRSGPINVPLNLAIVPSKAGNRVSFLTGFNMRRR